MKRRVGVVMCLIIGIAIAIAAGTFLFILNKGKEEKKSMFSKEIAPYTKRQEEQFTFEASGELNMKVIGSNVTIKQGDCKEISIQLTKEVGDKKEELLSEELVKITCRMDHETLEIGFLDGQKKVNSTYIEAKITVPETVKVIQCNCQTGDFKLKGSYEEIKVDSRVGNVDLDLDKLDSSNHIAIQGKIGDVKIKLPRKSKVWLRGTEKDGVKLGDGIILDESGAEIEIHKETSRISIAS